MSCVTLNAFDVSMATTQLTQAAHYEICWPSTELQITEPRPLHVNWVVVTDEHGKKQLRMQWKQS